MSDSHLQGPQAIPHGALVFLYVVVGVLLTLVAAWIAMLMR